MLAKNQIKLIFAPFSRTVNEILDTKYTIKFNTVKNWNGFPINFWCAILDRSKIWPTFWQKNHIFELFDILFNRQQVGDLLIDLFTYGLEVVYFDFLVWNRIPNIRSKSAQNLLGKSYWFFTVYITKQMVTINFIFLY